MQNIDKEKFGAFVAHLRKEKGLTQREVAEKLKISRSYVSRIEKKALEKLRREFERGNR